MLITFIGITLQPGAATKSIQRLNLLMWVYGRLQEKHIAWSAMIWKVLKHVTALMYNRQLAILIVAANLGNQGRR